MLTKQQQKLLVFIKEFQDENGISPSYDEMRCALNQKSKSSVHMLLTALVERGFVRKLNNKARAIEVIKSVHRSPLVLAASEGLPVKDQEISSDVICKSSEYSELVSVPFYGEQPSIFPLSVFLSNPEKVLALSKDSFSYTPAQDYCAFQVSGDSLKELAILNHDTVVFKMGTEVAPGQLVLAVVDDENIQMKKYELQDGKIILSAANKYMMPQVYDQDRVRIKGCMAGLIRKYL